MRFAISAVAAVAGTLLLGLAFYGQPAAYLQQAREQWDALMDYPTAVQAADPDLRVDDSRSAQVQHEIARLENEFAARQLPGTQPGATGLPTAMPPAPVAPMPPEVATSVPSTAATSTPPAVATPKMAAGMPSVASAPALTMSAPPGTTVPTAPRSEQPQSGQPGAHVAGTPAAVPAAVPERHEAAGDLALLKGELALVKPDQFKADPPRADPPRAEPLKADPSKAESAKPGPQRLASQRPTSAPPLSQFSPPRQEVDDTESILARLRQADPAPAQQADPPPAVEQRPRARLTYSPSLPGLTLARTALTDGRVEDARRLLQQAQLQLVFRPIDGAGEDLSLAGKGAADIAGALEALSANDIPLSRRYIDAAMDALSGTGTNTPIQESARRAAGYAPAYPPR